MPTLGILDMAVPLSTTHILSGPHPGPTITPWDVAGKCYCVNRSHPVNKIRVHDKKYFLESIKENITGKKKSSYGTSAFVCVLITAFKEVTQYTFPPKVHISVSQRPRAGKLWLPRRNMRLPVGLLFIPDFTVLFERLSISLWL